MAERVISIKITSDGKAFVVDQGANAEAAAKLGRQVEDTGRKIEGMGTKAVRAGRDAKEATSGVDRLADAVKKVGHYATGAIGVGLFAGWAGQVVQAMDAVSALDSRLKLVTAQESGVRRLRAEIYGIAQDTRTSMTELGNTYATLAKNGQQLGYSQDRLLTVSKAVGQALAIGGGAAQGQSAALVQLSQGLASGTLRGEELNSILEQTPRLAQAIADGMGITVGQLRAYGQEGKINALAVLDALEKSAPKLEAEFARVKPTISSAAQVWTNATQNFIGTVDEATDASGRLAGAVIKIADGIDAVGRVVEANKTAVGIIGGTVGGAAAIGAIVGIAAGVAKIAGAIGAVGVALAANPAVAVLLGLAAGAGAVVSVASAYNKTALGIGQTISALEEANRRSEAAMQRAGGRQGAQDNISRTIADRRQQIALLRGELANLDGSNKAVEDRRLSGPATVAPFPGAKPIEEVRKYVKLRDDIVREGYDQAVEMAKSYGNRIAAETDPEKRTALERERNTRLIQLNKDTQKQLADFGKAQSRDGDKAVEARVASIQAGLRMEQLAIADGVDVVDSLRKQELISEQTAVERKRDLRMQDLDAQAAALSAELKLVKTKQDSAKEQAQLEGQLKELAQQRVNTAAKAARDLDELYAKPNIALMNGVRQATQAIHDQATAQEAQNAVFGRGKVELIDLTIAQLEKSKADLQATNNVIPGYIEALEQQIAAQKRLRAAVGKGEDQDLSRKIVEEQAQAASRSVEIWRQKTDEITDTLIGGFSSVKSWAQREFNSLVLKPVFSPVAGAVQSLMNGGAAPAGGGVMGSVMGSGINAALGSFGSSAGSVAQGVFLGAGELSSLTFTEALSGGVAALAEGSIATGLGTLAGTLGPIVGGIALLASLTESKGGPKTEGGADIAKSIQAQYDALAREYGVKDRARFSAFSSKDPEGDSLTQLQVAAHVGDRAIYSRQDRVGNYEDIGRSDEAYAAAVAEEQVRALVRAFQESDLKASLKQYLDGITDASSVQDMQAALTRVSAARQLEEQLLELTSTDAEKLTRARDREIEAIGETLSPLLRKVHAAQDEAKAAKEAADSLRDVTALHRSYTDSAYSTLDRVVSRQREATEVARDLAKEQLEGLKAVLEMLRDQIAELYGEVDSTSSVRAAQGRAFIADALDTAQRTGYLPDEKALADAIKNARSGMDEDSFGTAFEADRARLVLAGQLSQLEGLAGRQQASVDTQYQEATARLKTLTDTLQAARDQVDEMRGARMDINNVEDAVKLLQDAVVNELRSQTSVLANVLAGLRGGSVSAVQAQQQLLAGGAKLSQDTWSDVNTPSGVQKVWASSGGAVGLGNDAGVTIYGKDGSTHDAAGAVGWAQAQIAAGNANSVYEGLARTGVSAASFDALMGYSAGTTAKWIDANALPKLDVGTNKMPRDMAVFAHEGEAILPKKFNPWAGGQMPGTSGDAGASAGVDAITRGMGILTAVMGNVQDSTRRMAVVLEAVVTGNASFTTELAA